MASSNLTSPLASPSATLEVLDSHGLNAKKSFGQNFLVNDAIIKKICNLANINKGDNVIEIGPGLGTLTIALLKYGARVLAIEKDTNMYQILKENVGIYCPDNACNLQIEQADALKIDKEIIKDFAKTSPIKMVSNLPYNVAAPLIITYFQNYECMNQACVMVQKEIADRILAKTSSKNYGSYTVKLSIYANCNGKFNVSPNNFIPAPRVDSTVINLVANKSINYNLAKNACEISDAAFAHRRKTISNSVKQYFSNDQAKAKQILLAFEKSHISANLRAETLSAIEFLNIAKNI